jgi:hypothetical protein
VSSLICNTEDRDWKKEGSDFLEKEKYMGNIYEGTSGSV